VVRIECSRDEAATLGGAGGAGRCTERERVATKDMVTEAVQRLAATRGGAREGREEGRDEGRYEGRDGGCEGRQ